MHFQIIPELRGLSIENLYAKYFASEAYNAHRAYGDVLAVEKLFTTTQCYRYQI